MRIIKFRLKLSFRSIPMLLGGVALLGAEFLSGCAVGMLTVQSTPEGAEVFLAGEDQQPTRLGKTPLNVNSQHLQSVGRNTIEIQIRKEGYATEHFMVPKMSLGSSVSISLKMQESKLPLSCQDQTAAVEKVARQVAQVQFLIQQKKFETAERILNGLIEDNPTSSVFYDLLGNVFYLKKDLELALDAYETSLRLNPGAKETQRMVNKLRSIRSPRLPTSEGGG